MLITIGGDDTAFSAMKVEQQSRGRLRVVHVPKTIDNDLDLPPHIDTFGFQTARHYGVEIVKNLMVDARTTSRWYFVIAMGRKAGHLALGHREGGRRDVDAHPRGVRRPAGPSQDDCRHACRRHREASELGRLDGVAVLAEGLVLDLAPEDMASLGHVEHDAHGHVRLAEINIGDIVKHAVRDRLHELKIKTTVATKDIGYELRCADPIPMDMEYTRDLGYCAAKYLLSGGDAVMISMQGGHFVPIPFAQMMDPSTGRTRVRLVDIHSTRYGIARRYMIRLRRDDFDDSEELAKLATTAGLSPDDFRREFGYLIEQEPGPLVVDRESGLVEKKT